MHITFPSYVHFSFLNKRIKITYKFLIYIKRICSVDKNVKEIVKRLESPFFSEKLKLDTDNVE